MCGARAHSSRPAPGAREWTMLPADSATPSGAGDALVRRQRHLPPGGATSPPPQRPPSASADGASPRPGGRDPGNSAPGCRAYRLDGNAGSIGSGDHGSCPVARRRLPWRRSGGSWTSRGGASASRMRRRRPHWGPRHCRRARGAACRRRPCRGSTSGTWRLRRARRRQPRRLPRWQCRRRRRRRLRGRPARRSRRSLRS